MCDGGRLRHECKIEYPADLFLRVFVNTIFVLPVLLPFFKMSLASPFNNY